MSKKINMAVSEFGAVHLPSKGALGERTMMGLLETLGIDPEFLGADDKVVGDMSCCMFGGDGRGNPWAENRSRIPSLTSFCGSRRIVDEGPKMVGERRNDDHHRPKT